MLYVIVPLYDGPEELDQPWGGFRLDLEYTSSYTPAILRLKDDILKAAEEENLELVSPNAKVYLQFKGKRNRVDATVYIRITAESKDNWFNEWRSDELTVE